MKVGIVHYGGGNVRSLSRAVAALGHDVFLVRQAQDFHRVSHLLFPGQGAYGDCLKKLSNLHLVEPVQEWIRAQKPFFGICVGYQLLFESSEEAPLKKGLGVLAGQVTKFRPTGIKIPHMGWNALHLQDPHHPLWAGLKADPYFYFVHSYKPQGVDSAVLAATCQYGGEFPAAVIQDALVGTQFHPEKSQHNGLKLLSNFLAL